jgi:dihydrofolate synthase/folylpolyglutamate synthase
MQTFESVVSYLESLSMMPKEMPGILKIKKALNETNWFSKIEPTKVIVVAGTNGKGSTCAILESLLVSAGKKVGFYSSPHLVDTTERIRINQKSISKDQFIGLFNQNKTLIEKFELTHFEALTVMAGDYFFNQQSVDYALFEVGLGGTFDATNAIPHSTSVVTALGLDHMNILGTTIEEIATNKFGIVQSKNLVIHHPLPIETLKLKKEIQEKTDSIWIQAEPVQLEIIKNNLEPVYSLKTKWGPAEMNLTGLRAAENAATALSVFEQLGFDPKLHLKALSQVQWQGRMQKVDWPIMQAPLYLSGDHNPQGLQSFLELIKDFNYQRLFLVVGIGKDKDAEAMLQNLSQLRNMQLYLTETPFKGLRVDEYPPRFLNQAVEKNKDVEQILNSVSKAATADDLVVVTGSLYLVGKVLSKIRSNK